jgi:hypothetical protein
MPEKPILIFPSPSIVSRYKMTGGADKEFRRPTRQTQSGRIGPKFQTLESAFENKRIEFQQDANGADPEMVLVFETRGTIKDFFNAVIKFPELEWLAEFESDFEQDELFYYVGTNKEIKGKIFFIMSNHQGLIQLQSLWYNYYVPGIPFQRGFTKWRDLFDLLYDVRPWGLKDRIEETGILLDWQQRINENQEIIPFEIELWFRTSPNQRLAARNNILQLIGEFEGQLLKETIIEEIAYHSVLVNAPIGIFSNLTDNTNISFFKASDIMYIRPVGQCAIGIGLTEDSGISDNDINSVPQLPPIIALLDGLPIQNHDKLANRLTIDDVDNFELNYPAVFRKHGTAMASIIIHGDINASTPPIKSFLYVRPVMKYFTDPNGGHEGIPENELTVDIFHRAVKRIFENEDGTPSEYKSVKIINISIGDPMRIFDNTMSSWARLLDWLSVKYNVLFIVSAGNCLEGIDFNLGINELRALCANPNNLTNTTIEHFFNGIRNRKIIAPAESINSLTVGAAHKDLSNGFPALNRLNIFNQDTLFSPISRFGLGYRRSIKPDLLMPGGRVLFNEPLGVSTLRLNNAIVAPGIKVAAPSPTSTINNTSHTRGTSNAAAMLSHTAALLHETLSEDNINDAVTDEYFPLLAKSLLVHGTSWNDSIEALIGNSINNYGGNRKDLVSRFVGYGELDSEKILECTSKRVTLIGFGDLMAEEAHIYKLPLPISISGQVAWRKLIVTLAWFSPVNCKNQIYRKSKLWIDFPDKHHEDLLSVSRKFYDHDTVNRGTVQHEIFEGTRAAVFTDGAFLPIRVNCKEDAPKLVEHVKYAISVTLEVDDALNVDIYNDIRVALQTQVQI